MRVPLSWLRDYVDIQHSPEQLAERLTLRGLEVGSIQDVTPVPFNGCRPSKRRRV